MQGKHPKKSIAVVGGGMTGIVAAIELAKSGLLDVTIFEKESRLGGLSSFYQWQDVICDRFYHVILPSDDQLLEFVGELGLERQLFWKKVKSGFYGKNRLVSFSSAIDFIRFPFLSLWQKFRLAVGLLFSVTLKDPKKLGSLLAQDWLVKIFGRKVYENFWEPLLRSKFGNARNRISATFIWATINRLYGARSSSQKQERMGQIRGGYHTILSEAEKRLSESHVRIMTSVEVSLLRSVRKLSPGSSMNGQVSSPSEDEAAGQIWLSTKAGEFRFDNILLTVASPAAAKILADPGGRPNWQNLGGADYLGVICVLLILGRRLSPYYLINLLDKELPFTGIIESTNVLSPDDFNNRHLVYLPRYLTEDDVFNRVSDGEILESFLGGLRKVFPQLRNEDILHAKIFRENYVQPLMGLSSIEHTASHKTPWPHVFLANTSFIRRSTLNNNAAVQIARKAANMILADMERG